MLQRSKRGHRKAAPVTGIIRERSIDQCNVVSYELERNPGNCKYEALLVALELCLACETFIKKDESIDGGSG